MVRAQTDTQAEPSGGMEGELDRPENLGQKYTFCTVQKDVTKLSAILELFILQSAKKVREKKHL